MLTLIRSRAWAALTSLKLAIACLAMLMVLVVACTLAQLRLGTVGAVNAYIRSFLVWGEFPGTRWSIPVAPGGGLVGAVLMVNLVAAQVKRLDLSWRKAGLWIIHAGLIALFVGEFVTSIFQVGTQRKTGRCSSFCGTRSSSTPVGAVTSTRKASWPWLSSGTSSPACPGSA